MCTNFSYTLRRRLGDINVCMIQISLLHNSRGQTIMIKGFIVFQEIDTLDAGFGPPTGKKQ